MLLHGYLFCCAVVSRANASIECYFAFKGGIAPPYLAQLLMKLLVPTTITELCTASAVLRLSWKKQLTTSHMLMIAKAGERFTSWMTIKAPETVVGGKSYICRSSPHL